MVMKKRPSLVVIYMYLHEFVCYSLDRRDIPSTDLFSRKVYPRKLLKTRTREFQVNKDFP